MQLLDRNLRGVPIEGSGGEGAGISKNVTFFRHSRGIPSDLLDI